MNDEHCPDCDVAEGERHIPGCPQLEETTMSEYDQPPQENTPNRALGQLSADTAKTQGPRTMLQEIMDRNGNHLVALDQINGRLWSILQGMTGPQPPNETACDNPSPEGSLHMIQAQQGMVDEKLREAMQTLEQIESIT